MHAQCTAELGGDHTGPGAEVIFDYALTNGLAAVMSAQWGETAATEKNGRRVRSAAALLDVVEEKAQEDPEEPGVFVIPDPAPLQAPNESLRSVWPWEGADSMALDTRIRVTVLRSGIKSTQPVRHASGRGGLQHEHIEALFALVHRKALCSGPSPTTAPRGPGPSPSCSGSATKKPVTGPSEPANCIRLPRLRIHHLQPGPQRPNKAWASASASAWSATTSAPPTWRPRRPRS